MTQINDVYKEQLDPEERKCRKHPAYVFAATALIASLFVPESAHAVEQEILRVIGIVGEWIRNIGLGVVGVSIGWSALQAALPNGRVPWENVCKAICAGAVIISLGQGLHQLGIAG